MRTCSSSFGASGGVLLTISLAGTSDPGIGASASAALTVRRIAAEIRRLIERSIFRLLARSTSPATEKRLWKVRVWFRETGDQKTEDWRPAREVPLVSGTANRPGRAHTAEPSGPTVQRVLARARPHRIRIRRLEIDGGGEAREMTGLHRRSDGACALTQSMKACSSCTAALDVDIRVPWEKSAMASCSRSSGGTLPVG